MAVAKGICRYYPAEEPITSGPYRHHNCNRSRALDPGTAARGPIAVAVGLLSDALILLSSAPLNKDVVGNSIPCVMNADEHFLQVPFNMLPDQP
jgi:hypothetical protein